MEKLIELVRQNPGLYDQSLSMYKDNVWTQNTWKKIADHLGLDDVDGKLKRFSQINIIVTIIVLAKKSLALKSIFQTDRYS